jgi:transcriptional regulator with XRE-family HTH domain
MHVAQKFERLLEVHRRPDGNQWTGQRLEEATGGVVTRSYFVNLRKGRIENPGYEKMRAIAKAMGFAPEAWFEEGVGREPDRPEDEASPARSSTSSMPSGTRKRKSLTQTQRLLA